MDVQVTCLLWHNFLIVSLLGITPLWRHLNTVYQGICHYDRIFLLTDAEAEMQATKLAYDYPSKDKIRDYYQEIIREKGDVIFFFCKFFPANSLFPSLAQILPTKSPVMGSRKRIRILAKLSLVRIEYLVPVILHQLLAHFQVSMFEKMFQTFWKMAQRTRTQAIWQTWYVNQIWQLSPLVLVSIPICH